MIRNRAAMVWVPLLAWLACDPDGPDVEGRDLVVEPVESSGGEDGGDEGLDEAVAEWQEGAPQVCEAVPIGLAGVEGEVVPALDGELGAIDEFVDSPDVAAGAVPCPLLGWAKSKYFDSSCNGEVLTCKHVCDCDTQYSSPCNPPHPHCGAPDHRSTTIVINHPMDSQAYCYAFGWAYCRKQTGLSALQSCAAWCRQNVPGRTRECPDCPPKQ